MNLGIYLSSLSDHHQLKDISDTINANIGSKLKDASIFYDNIAYNPFKINCGIFNSTDLWNFSGTLITTSLSTTMSALKIVNNIDIYYYYGFEDKISPLPLIYIINNSKVKFIANTKTNEIDLYRKTRTKSHSVCGSFNELVTGVNV